MARIYPVLTCAAHCGRSVVIDGKHEAGWMLRADGRVCPDCIHAIIGGKPAVLGDIVTWRSWQLIVRMKRDKPENSPEYILGPHIADVIQLALMSLMDVRTGDVFRCDGLPYMVYALRHLDARNYSVLMMGRNVTGWRTWMQLPARRDHVADVIMRACRALRASRVHEFALAGLPGQAAEAASCRMLWVAAAQAHLETADVAWGVTGVRAGPPRLDAPGLTVVQRIRMGDAPHPEQPCACVLCALPRGDGWGEVELERRVRWMGSEANQSLAALGAFTTGARTKGDGTKAPSCGLSVGAQS